MLGQRWLSTWGIGKSCRCCRCWKIRAESSAEAGKGSWTVSQRLARSQRKPRMGVESRLAGEGVTSILLKPEIAVVE